jgi:cytochrome bd-type quinol oxidase subunit 1
MAALVVVQIVTGLWAMELRGARADDAPITALAAAIPTLHVAVGALILGTSIVLSLGAWKLLRDTTPALHRGPLVPAQSEVNA